MSESKPFSFDRFQDKIRDAVASGHDLRQRVEQQIADALHETEWDGAGCQKMAEAVLEGARQGLAKAGSTQQDARLREVIDGLADGLRVSAQAIQLTVEEAASSGKRFADQDLRQAAANLKAAGNLFTEVLGQTAQQTCSEFQRQWERVGEHTLQAWHRVQPTVESAIHTAKENPLGSGKSALEAGFKCATHATGALFNEIGRRLQSMGDRLKS